MGMMPPITQFQQCIWGFFARFFSRIFFSLSNITHTKKKKHFQPERQKADVLNPLLETGKQALLREALYQLCEVDCNTAVNTKGLVLKLETLYA